ncbi:MAG: hypothetical protein BWY87_01390 [Deltaproteobacteria bacterium ADurb.Bin510]|nr:MAG: hypothetical protein BWY87_01390 [Deltaproteobacteria bacterium ADurb.Bin510]
MPMLLLSLMMSRRLSQPYFSWSWKVAERRVYSPFSQKIELAGEKKPLSRPQATQIGFMIEPGSKIWLTARLVWPMPWLRLLGLKLG